MFQSEVPETGKRRKKLQETQTFWGPVECPD